MAGPEMSEVDDEGQWDAPAFQTGDQVTYTFPVEIEVVGQFSEEQLHRVAEHVFDELDTALRAQG